MINWLQKINIIRLIFILVIYIKSNLIYNSSQVYNIIGKSLSIQKITGQRYAQWCDNNTVNILGPFPTYIYQTSIDMTTQVIGNTNPSKIKINNNGTLLVALQRTILCWIDFTNNSKNCNDGGFIQVYDANDFQFLNQWKKIVITQSTSNLSIIVDLNIPIIYFTQTLSNQILFLDYFQSSNKVIGIKKSQNICIMSLNSSDLNYHKFIDTSITTTKTVIGIKGFQRIGQQSILIANDDNTCDIFSLINSSILGSITLTQNIEQFSIYDGTIVLLLSNQSLFQYDSISLIQIGSVSFAQSIKLLSKLFQTGSANQTYIINSQQNIQPTSIINIQINGGMSNCIQIDPNCLSCNLNTLLTCQQCILPFNLSPDKTMCLSTVCMTGFTFNYTSLSCQLNCLSNQIYNSSLALCQCQTGMIIDSTDNITCVYPPNNTNNSSSSIQYCIQYNNLNKSECKKCLQYSYILKNNLCQNIQLIAISEQIQKGIIVPLSFPSIKTIFQSTIYIFLFLDDYWYYIYHNTQYRPQVQNLFQLVKEANENSLIPQFVNLSFIQVYLSPKLYLLSDYSAFTPQKIIQIENINDIQFLERTFQMYGYNYTCSIILFFIVKFLVKIINLIWKQKPNGIKKSIFQKILHFTNYKTLLVSLIQGNIVYISFNYGIQMLQPANYMFQDKLSQIVGHLLFIIALIYSLCFYMVIYGVEQKKQSKKYLNISKYSLSGFYNQSFLMAIKSLINGFIHGYLIYNYQIQMPLLIFLKALLLFIILKVRKCFQYKFILAIFIIYLCLGIILDFILLLDYQYQVIYQTQFGIIETIMLIGLFCLTCLMFFYNFLVEIYYRIKNYLVQKNKIVDDSQTKKQNKKIKGNQQQKKSTIKLQIFKINQQINGPTQIQKQKIMTDINQMKNKQTIDQLLPHEILQAENIQKNLFIQSKQITVEQFYQKKINEFTNRKQNKHQKFTIKKEKKKQDKQISKAQFNKQCLISSLVKKNNDKYQQDNIQQVIFQKKINDHKFVAFQSNQIQK